MKRWYKMLTGNSIYHVKQGEGRIYSKDDINGYYNDLTQKVLKDEKSHIVEIPKVKLENGDEAIFPVTVFQYGLGAYDLYLMDSKKIYFDKFMLTSRWALTNQKKNGAWCNPNFKNPEHPYSAMAQGEGASLLIRAYKESSSVKYLEAAKRAINFMLIPVDDGGTTLYINQSVFLQEYTYTSTVLNGWIFAVFGLFDYVKISGDPKIHEVLNKTVINIADNLHMFDNGYWSMYNMDTVIASPFYHGLHIALLKVLYHLFGLGKFNLYYKRWTSYQNNQINKTKAFLVKAFQKMTEK